MSFFDRPKIWLQPNQYAWPEPEWQARLAKLPERWQRYVSKYHRWQDRQAGLIGRELLNTGLEAAGYSAEFLERLTISDYGRPSLPLPFDFNLTHCPGWVVLGFYRDRIGIDIEPIRPVTIRHFHSVLSMEERQALQNLRGEAQDHLFATIWTRKEAAIKAEGKGFYNHLKTVTALEAHFQLAGQHWYCRKVSMPKPYICHFATAQPVQEFNCTFIK